MKTCKACKEIKSPSVFYSKGKQLTARCKPCHRAMRRSDPREKERQRRWKKDNSETWAAYMRRFRRNHPGYDKRSTYLKGKLRVRPFAWHQMCDIFGGCAYCNAAAVEVDHFIPRALGGSDSWDNLVPSCRSCNASKNAHHPKDWCEPETYNFIKATLEEPFLITGKARGKPGATRGKQARAVQPQRLSGKVPLLALG